jgi:hypothetical protein
VSLCARHDIVRMPAFRVVRTAAAAVFLLACGEPTADSRPYWILVATAQADSGGTLVERCSLFASGVLGREEMSGSWEGRVHLTVRRESGIDLRSVTQRSEPSISARWQRANDRAVSLMLLGTVADTLVGTAHGPDRGSGSWICRDDTVGGGLGRTLRGEWSLARAYPID